MTTLSTVPTMSRSSNTASTTRNRESRKRHNDDDLIVRIAHEMPLFKFVPVAWLSERWDDDVGDWLRTMPEEKRRAFGYDFKDLEDFELGPGEHMCMVVVGPGAHNSWNQVRHELIVTNREEFEQLLAPTAAKAERAKRWLMHDAAAQADESDDAFESETPEEAADVKPPQSAVRRRMSRASIIYADLPALQVDDVQEADEPQEGATVPAATDDSTWSNFLCSGAPLSSHSQSRVNHR